MKRQYKIRDFLEAMYESTQIIIHDEKTWFERDLYRGKKKDLPKEFYDKIVISQLGVMEENRWYFTIKN